MRVLALDLSTSTGYAVFDVEEGAPPKLMQHGIVKVPGPAQRPHEYPWTYYFAADAAGESIRELVESLSPTHIVIEETNLGRNRYSQKILEYIHCQVLLQLATLECNVSYVNTQTWRSKLGIFLSKADKAQNTRLSRAKREARLDGQKLDKKALGIRGKVNKKHIAIRYVNEQFGLQLKAKDDDVADAICMALAFTQGVSACDGKDAARKKKTKP